MITFGRNLKSRVVATSMGVFCEEEGEDPKFLKAEHFDFEKVIKMCFLKNGFVFLTNSGRLFDTEKERHLIKKKIVDIAVGKFNKHYFVIDEDSNLYSWGFGNKGELGYLKQMTKRKIFPKMIDPANFNHEGIMQVAGGDSFSVALTHKNNVYCWGEVGDGEIELTPKLLSFEGSSINQIVCGSNHALSLSQEGEVFSWGTNDFGVLGIGTNDGKHYSIPQKVDLKHFKGRKIVQIQAGNYHNLALTENGELYTWGAGSNFNMLGQNDKEDKDVPTLVEGIKERIVEILDGLWLYSVVKVESGKYYAWGKEGTKKPRAIIDPLLEMGE